MNPLERVGLWLTLSAYLVPMFFREALAEAVLISVTGGALLVCGGEIERLLRRRWPHISW
jgi:hypothetical protein